MKQFTTRPKRTFKFSMMFWMFVVMIITFEKSHVTQSANTTYVKQSIVDHFSDTRHYSAQKYRAISFIQDQFRGFGLNVTDTVNDHEIRYHHIIGIYPGTNFGTQHDKIIFVCANYATEETTKGEDRKESDHRHKVRGQSVDHNGSGIASLLEVARQLSSKKEKLKHTVILLSIDGLAGVNNFFLEWLPRWLDKNYDNKFQVKPYGIIILDTIMNFNSTKFSQKALGLQFKDTFPVAYDSMSSNDYKGDFIALFYRDSNGGVVASTFDSVWTDDSRKPFKIEHFPLPLLSAHLLDVDERWIYMISQFLKNVDLPTIIVTDTAKYRGRMEVCYQKECDNLPTMMTDDNIAFIGKTADVVASTVWKLSTDNGVISPNMGVTNPDKGVTKPDILKCGGTTVNIHCPLIVAVVAVVIINMFSKII